MEILPAKLVCTLFELQQLRPKITYIQDPRLMETEDLYLSVSRIFEVINDSFTYIVGFIDQPVCSYVSYSYLLSVLLVVRFRAGSESSTESTKWA